MKNKKTITLNLTEIEANALVTALLAYEEAWKEEVCLCTNLLMLSQDRKTKDDIFDYIQSIRGKLPESISLI